MRDQESALSPVAESALACIEERGLAAPGGAPLVLMVSGGSDSTAMTLVALELAEAGRLDPGRVAVLNVNHGLRHEAEWDAQFVRRLALACGFPCMLADIDIPAHLDEFDGNVESAGRYLRYREAGNLLDEACDNLGHPRDNGRIWVAHTEDDRVETFFMRAIVGTGPGGLAGMDYRNGRIVRPLMHCSRAQLRDYIVDQVKQRDWQLDDPHRAQVPLGCWREDHTNHEDDGFRAFVRNRIVPLAAERNPALGPTMGRMCDLLLEESAYIGRQVDELRTRAAREVDGCTAIDAALLAEAPAPLASRLLHDVCAEHLPVAKRIESQHILEMLRRADDPAFSMDVPGGISAWHESGELVIGQRVEAAWLEPLELAIPGETVLPDGRILRVEVIEPDTLPEDASSALIDTDLLDGGLMVSGPRTGERMCPLGMDGSHKLVSDILSEAKVPRRLRAGVPVVRNGDRIVWLAGIRLDNRFRITPETTRAVRLTLE